MTFEQFARESNANEAGNRGFVALLILIGALGVYVIWRLLA